MQAVWKHKAAIWRRGEGKVGRRGLPYLVLFQVALPMLNFLALGTLLIGLLGCNRPAPAQEAPVG